MKFGASFPQIYGFEQAKPIPKLTLELAWLAEIGKSKKKLAHLHTLKRKLIYLYCIYFSAGIAGHSWQIKFHDVHNMSWFEIFLIFSAFDTLIYNIIPMCKYSAYRIYDSPEYNS